MAQVHHRKGGGKGRARRRLEERGIVDDPRWREIFTYVIVSLGQGARVMMVALMSGLRVLTCQGSKLSEDFCNV